MYVSFYKSALVESLLIYGKPEIFNSDQGSQFKSKEFTKCFKQQEIEICIDRTGRCHDNIFIERLWCFLKYELIYIYSFEQEKHLTEEVNKWFNFYNKVRFPQALEYQMPEQVYGKSLKLA